MFLLLLYIDQLFVCQNVEQLILLLYAMLNNFNLYKIGGIFYFRNVKLFWNRNNYTIII